MAADLRLHLLGAEAMTGRRYWRGWTPSLGLIAGLTLWGTNLQVGLIIPYTECGAPWRPAFLVSLVATGLVLLSGWLSCRKPWAGHTGRFWSRTCALLAMILAFA